MKISEKPLLIIGGSGHAKVLIDCIVASGRKPIGILDRNLEKGESISGVDVLGDDSILEEFAIESIELVNGLGVLPGKKRRWNLGVLIEEKGYRFASIVHPSAVISTSASLDTGAQVMAGCVLQNEVRVGSHSVVNTSVSVDHGTIIEEQCWLSPGVVVCADVHIGPRSYIGAGATIIQNISIGQGVLVAAGSNILSDCF